MDDYCNLGKDDYSDIQDRALGARCVGYVRKDPAGTIQWRQSFRGWRALRVSLSFSRHNKNIKMEHFFLIYFISLFHLTP